MNRSKLLLNHYQTLGLSYRATQAEVKASFRELAKKYHPDQNANDSQAESRFRSIKEAYECLSNKTRRAEYDKEWVRTGKLTWDSNPAASETSEAEPNTGQLSRRDLMVFYGLIVGLPFASMTIRRQKQVEDVNGNVEITESMWATPTDLPVVYSSDTVVPAFFNPFTRQWERVASSESPPTPLELLQFVVREHRGLYQSFAQSGKLKMPSKEDRFEIVSIPERITSLPMLIHRD
jgi:curved DNA-binding protein CbpA